MCKKIYFNTTTCPFCGLECGSHTRLIAHMIACASSRVNWNSGKLITAVAAGLVAVSLFVSAPTAKAQDAPQPTPTVTSVGEPPKALETQHVYLPFVVTPDDGPTGQGRYWGGVAQYVSWCPSCKG